MTNTPSFEIPDAVREIAEKNVSQARSAYDQFMQMAQQAQEMIAKSQGEIAAKAVDVQTQAMRYAEDNINANFDFAARLARARDLNEYMQIQRQYAESQLKSYSNQAQQLGQLMTAAMQAGQPKR